MSTSRYAPGWGAFALCQDCGAAVGDRAAHDRFHGDQAPATTRDLPHPHHPRAIPFRDNDGHVVTITQLQMRAIQHALVAWADVCRAEGSTQAEAAFKGGGWGLPANVAKSRALGRLLIEGKPLFKDKPPMHLAACDYPKWDEENGEGQ